jgi:hypothetical protein
VDCDLGADLGIQRQRMQGTFMIVFKAPRLLRVLKPLVVFASLTPLLVASRSAALTLVVTPGEQNTQSGENGCAATPCAGGHWLAATRPRASLSLLAPAGPGPSASRSSHRPRA